MDKDLESVLSSFADKTEIPYYINRQFYYYHVTKEAFFKPTFRSLYKELQVNFHTLKQPDENLMRIFK